MGDDVVIGKEKQTSIKEIAKTLPGILIPSFVVAGSALPSLSVCELQFQMEKMNKEGKTAFVSKKPVKDQLMLNIVIKHLLVIRP